MKELTYHTYNPYTDKLEVGTKIRLAGREGEITGIENTLGYYSFWVLWKYDKGIESGWIYLFSFPGLEIEVPPAKPLTIDKRVKTYLLETLPKLELVSTVRSNKLSCDIIAYLNSLEEV